MRGDYRSSEPGAREGSVLVSDRVGACRWAGRWASEPSAAALIAPTLVPHDIEKRLVGAISSRARHDDGDRHPRGYRRLAQAMSRAGGATVSRAWLEAPTTGTRTARNLPAVESQFVLLVQYEVLSPNAG
jgi:hypothetical protein